MIGHRYKGSSAFLDAARRGQGNPSADDLKATRQILNEVWVCAHGTGGQNGEGEVLIRTKCPQDADRLLDLLTALYRGDPVAPLLNRTSDTSKGSK